MKSKWVIQILGSHLPSRLSTILSPSKTLLRQNPSSTFVLNNVDISILLSTCGKERWFNLGSSLHASIIKNPEFINPENENDRRNSLVIWNSLLSMYSNCGDLVDAANLFDEMPMRDTISWNTIISGFLTNGMFGAGVKLFKQMIDIGSYFALDQATLTTVLSVFDKPVFYFANKMIHCLVFLSGYQHEITVGNALITSYNKCGCSDFGMQVFDEMTDRNVITWTAVISGLVQNEFYHDSLKMFIKMRNGPVDPNSFTYLSSLMACSGLLALTEGCQIHGLLWKLGMQSDLRIESALMDMYSKCGNFKDAWQIFVSAEELDEVTMTVILVGLAQNGFEEEAMQFFLKMVRNGVDIDVNMVSAVLGVFGVDTSLISGKQLHSLVIKRSFSANPFVNNGIINMYSKCGSLEDSVKVFTRMPEKNSVSWNSIIAAFARHGDGYKAIHIYEDMIAQGVNPTDVTFLSLLHACSHVGLVSKGMEFWNSMVQFGIQPRTEHYACLVDMLGRAGLLKEAKSFIEGLPLNPDELVLQALLGGCSFHGDVEIGKYTAEKLFSTSSKSHVPYILMANIYSSEGKWRERAKTIKRMKEVGVAKLTGLSWIEIGNKVHSFVVEDKLHSEAESIYGVLAGLFPVMVDEGYVPDKKCILYYLGEDVETVSS